MPNTTISFDIENELLIEIGASIARVFDRNDDETDIELVKRYIESLLVKRLNKKRSSDSTWTEVDSVFS